MIIERFYEEKLAQASYLVGCGKSGEAIVIDPNRSIQMYMDKAEDKGLRITAVTETHIHADYVSGSRELAHAAGATLYLSDEGTDDWKYAFANEPNVKLLRDGDAISIGNLRFDVVKTPGHTPEHITFVLTDAPASDEPYCAFTGDFIFAGDVGRPDLLERAAGMQGTMAAGARTLFDSLQTFAQYDDGLVLYPGHGAGSACGKSLGGTPSTSLGYERKANWGFKVASKSTFVESVLEGQPDPPPYFKEMKRINKTGPSILHERLAPSREPLSEIGKDGAFLLDIRDAAIVATSLIPGAINIPLGKSFVKWAGWLIPYDRPIHLVAESERDVTAAVADLALIGLENAIAWAELSTSDKPLTEVVPQLTSEAIADSNEFVVLDVRSESEHENARIPGSINIPLGRLAERIHELPSGRQIAVQCGTGTRSAIAVSVLRKLGITGVSNLTHGFAEYEAKKLPIETGPTKQVVLT